MIMNEEMYEKGFKTQFRTGGEQAEIARRGGIKSGETRRRNKLLREDIMKRMKVRDYNEMIDNLIERAKYDNKAFETLRDTIGQKPTEKIDATVDAVTICVDLVDED